MQLLIGATRRTLFSAQMIMLPLIASAVYLVCICGPIHVAATGLASSNVRKDSLVDCLRGKIAKPSIITPSDASFVDDSIRWTSLGAPSYSVLVNARSEEDIANSVCNALRRHAMNIVLL